MRGWGDFAERGVAPSAKSPKNRIMISTRVDAFLFLRPWLVIFVFLRCLRAAGEPALPVAVV
jgi:hypothetical protein